MEKTSKLGRQQEDQNGQGFERSASALYSKENNKDLDIFGKDPDALYSRSKSILNSSKRSFEGRRVMEKESCDSKDGSDGRNNLDNKESKVSQQVNGTDDESILIKTILSADFVSLDLTLKRMNHRLDLTEVISAEHGYTLLHCAVFKDSDHIVYSLCKHIMDNPSETFDAK